MKVAVCFPVHNQAKAEFTLSLAALIAWSAGREITYNQVPARAVISPYMVKGSSRIDEAREGLAEAALKDGNEYILFVDDDQTFPQDALFRLASHDLPFVGCNYPRKRLRTSTASMIREGEWRPIEPRSEGIEPVDAIGFGVCLLKAQVLTILPRPWFAPDAHGEDGYFCEQARKHGIQPHVDHALSMEVGHIAETVLTFPR